MKYYLYNPLANNGVKPEFIKEAENASGVEVRELIDISYPEFLNELQEGDEVVLVGGDGTVNYFVNAIEGYQLKNNVYIRAAGTGNDFLHDLGAEADKEVLLNPYVTNLPVVHVKELSKRFINGVGYGIDGYCCEMGDKQKATSDKPVNYTSIAIKGLLFHFKPVNAKVTVDGETYTYEKVWLAPTMKGRFYGGGMMIAPAQDRKGDTVSVVIYQTGSKLKALINFPKIFKGEHIKKEKIVHIHTGKEIQVEFDRPCALQIDGETVLDVTEYTVRA